MHAAADLLDAELDEVAALVSTEMGKTIGTAKYEVSKSARGMRWYADHAEEYLADEHPVLPGDVGASAVSVRFSPSAPVLAVMPWNYPFWQVIRFAAPALMAGNAGLLKHASNVPAVRAAIWGLFERGGFPRVRSGRCSSRGRASKAHRRPAHPGRDPDGIGRRGPAVAERRAATSRSRCSNWAGLMRSS